MLSTKIWLEANTERSESNPGRSLGITNNSWRAVWKTVPHWCAHSPLARSPRSKSITDNADATDLFFHGLSPPSCPPLGMKGLALATWVSSWQSVTKEKPLQGGVGEGLKIRRIGVIREPFERVRTEPNAKEHNNVVLSSRLNKVIGNR